ncbi:MAG: undecaprenyl-phosphate glucose phosphotransferase [Crocinitomicaceae bacterium]|nr:undecaprenyl-phosphate glucose phosphotransferase [Crocinitomicaceae bacterium]
MKTILLLWDLVLLNVAYPLSLWLRYGNLAKLDESEIKTVWLFANALWVGLVLYKNAYKLMRVERIENLLGRTFRILLIHSGIIAVSIIVLDYDQISRLRMLYFFLSFYGSVILFRIVFLKLIKYVRAQGYNFRNVIIVGCNKSGTRIARIVSSDLSYGFRVAGFFDDAPQSKYLENANIIGKIDEIEAYLSENKVHEMYIALHFNDADRITELIKLCEKYMVRVKFVPDFHEYTRARKVTIDFYESTPVLMLRKEPLEIPAHRLVKKLFDILFSLLVIVGVFSWLFPILMILIKSSSAGPVFFRQKRTGEDNKAFTCLKFRTMRVNSLADELQATAHDPRITRLGAFMRKTNLDELPQFFNVLWGNMSVVGPRPHMIKHTEQYAELIHNYLVRHYAKPGITGWAQVNGYRGETKELIDMKKRVEFDIWYIENWSFLLDIKIVWLTVWNMIRGEEKAY